MTDHEETFQHQVVAWTVGDLRRALANVPDDAQLAIETPDAPGSRNAGDEFVVAGAARGHDWVPPSGEQPGRWELAHRLELIADHPSGVYYGSSDQQTAGIAPAYADPAAVQWDQAIQTDPADQADQTEAAPTAAADDVASADGPVSDHALTGTRDLPDAVAPAWVDGYLTGHDRGMAEGREAGYAEYDRQLVDGLAGMLAGDPTLTDYRDGVRRHEKTVAARQRREAFDRGDYPADYRSPDSSVADGDGWEL